MVLGVLGATASEAGGGETTEVCDETGRTVVEVATKDCWISDGWISTGTKAGASVTSGVGRAASPGAIVNPAVPELSQLAADNATRPNKSKPPKAECR